MDAETLDLTEDLADELATNDRIDPRSIPTRYSLLKKLALSPAHYLHAAQQPQDDESLVAKLSGLAPVGTKRPEAFRIGSAIHYLLLGDPGKIGVIDARRGTKTWASSEASLREEGCVELLNPRENALVRSLFGAIQRNEIAMRLLFDGTIIETRIDWTFNGKATRSTPDARRPRGHVVDLKSTVCAEPEAFMRHGGRLFYHAQAALYLDAIETLDARPEEAYVIAVEKSPPFPVSVFRFHERTLERGAKLCRAWIERLVACETTNEWPEYLLDVGTFDLGGDDLELEFKGRRVAV